MGSGMCSFGRCYCSAGYCLDAKKGLCLRTLGSEMETMPASPFALGEEHMIAPPGSELVATEQCTAHTAGSCRFFSCHASRGPTDCVAHKCVCKPGLCSIDSKCQCARSGMCSFGRCYCSAGYCLDAKKGLCLRTLGSEMETMPASPFSLGEESVLATTAPESYVTTHVALSALIGGLFGAAVTVALVKLFAHSKNPR